jgi:pyridoxamine 5'-phosphate oxidase
MSREDIRQFEKQLNHESVKKPADWGGFRVSPLSIEFLTFQSDRFHLREVFSLNDNTWTKTQLQP